MTFKLHRFFSMLLIGVLVTFTGIVTAFAVGSILGDADNSGSVTINDVTCIQKNIAELPVDGGFSALAADVDGSGSIDIADATLIQIWLADLEIPYPIGEPASEPTTAPSTKLPTDDEGWGYIIFQP
ncbi:MAG: dockerin type I repeat-containing protein [Ruminococcus sp.]|nr:dockerin type I repeat-containing protein [Ruminococcus sp.]